MGGNDLRESVQSTQVDDGDYEEEDDNELNLELIP